MQGDPKTSRQVKHWLRWLFGGGIIDPTYPFSLRALEQRQNVDFGLISLARNPFAADDRVLSVHLAGFHLFGTAHAIRMLSDRSLFKEHEYGGVLRVSIEQSDDFATPFDRSTATWDTDSHYGKDDLISGLERLVYDHSQQVHVDGNEFKETVEFVRAL